MSITSAVKAASASAAANQELERLRALPRRRGQASFFYYEGQFGSPAVKILPGEYFVHNRELPLLTTLGSCIAACIWDRGAQVGGMNHFLLPDGAGESGRYGAFAMELLINELIKLGARRSSLEAKVFGGGQVIEGMKSINVGERNTEFVLDYLKLERIPVVSKDVLGEHARKVCFLPVSGKAMVRRMTVSRPDVIDAQERMASMQSRRAAAGGTVDLF